MDGRQSNRPRDEVSLPTQTFDLNLDFEYVTFETQPVKEEDMEFPLFSGTTTVISLSPVHTEPTPRLVDYELTPVQESILYQQCETVSVTRDDIIQEAKAYVPVSGPLLEYKKSYPRRLSKFNRRRIRLGFQKANRGSRYSQKARSAQGDFRFKSRTFKK